MEWLSKYFLTFRSRERIIQEANKRVYDKIRDVEFQIATLVDLWREVADKHPGVTLDVDVWKVTKRQEPKS